MGIFEVQASHHQSLLARSTNTYSAFSPCQITGFFQIHDNYSDLARQGSTGAGVNLEQGVRTSVSLRSASRNRAFIRLNGRVLKRPFVSSRVVDDYLSRSEGCWRVEVEHHCRLPVGAGYGTSGAGAASLSLALNSAFGNHLNRTEALQIAHVADAAARTGLGTVASVSEGGLAVRVKPGAPGIGTVRRITAPSHMRVVSGSLGLMSKARVLSSNTLRDRINLCSRGLVEGLLKRPDATNFVRLSRRFSDCLGLVSVRLRMVLDELDGRGVVASMMMLGNGVFCLVPKRAAGGIAREFRSTGMSSLISRIGREGAHLI